MIQDKILFDGETILEIYHIGFDDQVGDREIVREKDIQNHKLRFEEKYVEKYTLDKEPYDVENGVLDCEHILNPYRTEASATITHYMMPEKPSILSEDEEDIKLLNEINKFVETYMGIEISQCPVIYGDVIISEACICQMKETKDAQSVVIKNPPINTEIVVTFKNENGVVVCVKKAKVTSQTEEIKIPCDVNYEELDINIYAIERDSDEGVKTLKLLYRRMDLCFMRTCNLVLSMGSPRNKYVPVKKIAPENKENIKMPEERVTSNILIGKTDTSEIKQNMAMLNRKLLSRLRSCLRGSRYYINKGNKDNKEKIAEDILIKKFSNAKDCIWIIDSYFFDDKNGKYFYIDWLRVLHRCQCSQVNIIFNVPKGDRNNSDMGNENYEDFRKNIEADPIIRRYRLGQSVPKINLIATNKAIHDRFVFTKSGEVLQGVIVGTSFNSFDTNIFLLYELPEYDAGEILNELLEEINKDKKYEEEL